MTPINRFDCYKKKRMCIIEDDSGVSEAIGFIIIFGIIVTGIGLVTLYGYPVIMKQQMSASIRNMERGFFILQSDMNNLLYKSVPYHETNIQVSDGTLWAINSSDTSQYFTITKNPSPVVLVASFKPGELRYSTTDQQFTATLENGAVNTFWWSSLDGSVMLTKPRWFVDDTAGQKTVVINLVQFNTTYLAKSGNSRVEMRLEPFPFNGGSSLIDEPALSVNISYTKSSSNDYRVAWWNYFETLGGTRCPSSNDNPIWVNLPAARVVIKGYRITILNL